LTAGSLHLVQHVYQLSQSSHQRPVNEKTAALVQSAQLKYVKYVHVPSLSKSHQHCTNTEIYLTVPIVTK